MRILLRYHWPLLVWLGLTGSLAGTYELRPRFIDRDLLEVIGIPHALGFEGVGGIAAALLAACTSVCLYHGVTRRCPECHGWWGRVTDDLVTGATTTRGVHYASGSYVRTETVNGTGVMSLECRRCQHHWTRSYRYHRSRKRDRLGREL